jgi:hypothetical protein
VEHRPPAFCASCILFFPAQPILPSQPPASSFPPASSPELLLALTSAGLFLKGAPRSTSLRGRPEGVRDSVGRPIALNCEAVSEKRERPCVREIMCVRVREMLAACAFSYCQSRLHSHGCPARTLGLLLGGPSDPPLFRLVTTSNKVGCWFSSLNRRALHAHAPPRVGLRACGTLHHAGLCVHAPPHLPLASSLTA